LLGLAVDDSYQRTGRKKGPVEQKPPPAAASRRGRLRRLPLNPSNHFRSLCARLFLERLTAAYQAERLEFLRNRAQGRAIVQRTKIPESLGEILKNLAISTPKKIISVAEPASSPAAA
jgi:hypothetical protein